MTRTVTAGAILLLSTWLAACAGPRQNGTQASNTDTPTGAAEPSNSVSDDNAVEAFRRRSLLSFEDANAIGFRIDWQIIGLGAGPYQFASTEDRLFILDQRNVLTCLELESGDRIWSHQVLSPTADAVGLVTVPPRQKLFVMTGGDSYDIDMASGDIVGRQRLRTIANTDGVPVGDVIIYGSRNGQVIWHNYMTAFQLRAYQVADTINIKPVVDGDYIVAVGSAGEVMALSGSSGGQYWNRTLLDRVVARPAIGLGAVFVAGLDQHLRAFEAQTGQPIWSVLTESELVDSPVLVGERLYQQVPGLGLHCYEAVPVDERRGVLHWQLEDVHGSVIGTQNGQLVVWNEQDRRVVIVDASQGAVVSEADVPNMASLQPRLEGSRDFIASNNDGRIARIVPR